VALVRGSGRVPGALSVGLFSMGHYGRASALFNEVFPEISG
jgi:hypothetical protein